MLVEKLLVDCHANVNGGSEQRPSALDVAQFNRAEQKFYDRQDDDAIERLLLSHGAQNRCQLQRKTTSQRAVPDTSAVEPPAMPHDETAQNFARSASVCEKNGDIDGALENYQRAMDCVSTEALEGATYAFHVATLRMVRGEDSRALDLLRQALTIRQRFEQATEDIDRLQHAIATIQQRAAIEH